MVESRDEVSNDGSIRQFQGEKTALGLYGVCTCGVASPKMMLQTVPNGGKTPNPAVVQPVSVHFVPTRQMANATHIRTRRVATTRPVGSRGPRSALAGRLQRSSNSECKAPLPTGPLPERKKEGSNGGCCWLRHVSTVAPWVDMGSTYDLPGLFWLVLPVQKRQTAPLLTAMHHGSA
ncbi:hypothetical protein MAA_11579 [Metarhizium robertsii ARSEF 23]|uniref:Uncharacterized protein n=1 Tax=Metarhizium robertsii (strain ARSEF 23 / ATCC MYA-3075) TaxID=655844 RepID=A0A0B2X7C4_METRA|nr:uncharacterized protein MAA_11579 [Metarhizium robertsii ARSEF 23]KHO10818.1 hypothetical protein MAA_11579 [Metarhizium robertsii ARSEF 23]